MKITNITVASIKWEQQQQLIKRLPVAKIPSSLKNILTNHAYNSLYETSSIAMLIKLTPVKLPKITLKVKTPWRKANTDSHIYHKVLQGFHVQKSFARD